MFSTLTIWAHWHLVSNVSGKKSSNNLIEELFFVIGGFSLTTFQNSPVCWKFDYISQYESLEFILLAVQWAFWMFMFLSHQVLEFFSVIYSSNIFSTIYFSLFFHNSYICTLFWMIVSQRSSGFYSLQSLIFFLSVPQSIFICHIFNVSDFFSVSWNLSLHISSMFYFQLLYLSSIEFSKISFLFSFFYFLLLLIFFQFFESF